MAPATYEERVTSKRTTALFVALAVLFLGLWGWRLHAGDHGLLTGVLGCFGFMFLFYVLNYRTLVIRVDEQALRLTFGVFTWTVPRENIASAALDELPEFMKNGGAGIHFMTIRGRYRVSFNHLEYPRVVVGLKKPTGPVKDVSFTTRRPEEVMRALGQGR